MPRGSSSNGKVCVIIVLILMVGWIAVARAENRRRIVVFAPGVSLLRQLAIVTSSSGLMIHSLSLIDAMAIEPLPLVSVLDVVAELLTFTGEVLAVYDDPMGIAESITPVSSQEFSQEGYQWGQALIGVDGNVHNVMGLQGAGVNIAILDSGIASHSELRIAGGYNALRGGAGKSFADSFGHGTHMAGIIAAKAGNGPGIIGIAPQANIWAVKVLDNNGFGYVSDVIKGLQWADEHNIRLLNISLGFTEANHPLQKATKLLADRGVIMVASAGNKSCSPGQCESGGSDDEDALAGCDASQITAVKVPAAYPWVIAVAAVARIATNPEDPEDPYVPTYSLSGSEVDVVAPGGAMESEQILSTYLGGGYGRASGTSQAAAHVTGSVALVLQQNPTASFGEILNRLRENARHLTGYSAAEQGAGLINVCDMVQVQPCE